MANCTKNFRFSNGDKVKEKITGFTGVITGTCFYITGCNQYLITSRSKDDSNKNIQLWYDEGRLDLVKSAKVVPNEVSTEEPGCDLVPNIGERGA